MSRAPRVLLSGYYGFGNAGDEAVLAGLIDTFRAAVPEIAITVASADPEGTRSLHGVEAFPRFRWRDFCQALRGSDALVSGGGSLFQDVTSRRSVYYYLGTLVLAGLCRRPVMICGQGIGPLQAPLARRLTAALLNHARLITVRDPASVEALTALGVVRPPVHLTADPVLAMTPVPPPRAEAILRQAGVDLSRPRVAFALREWPAAANALESWSETAAFVHRELGAQAVLVPLHPPADVALAARVAERAGVPTVRLAGGYAPREWPALFGCMDLVVALRLHALIFAATQGVPLIGVSYDPKIDGFLRLLDRTPAGDAASITGEALCRALRNTWEARQAEAQSLKQKAAHLKRCALMNGELLSRMLA